jgi:hypothetical protein
MLIVSDAFHEAADKLTGQSRRAEQLNVKMRCKELQSVAEVMRPILVDALARAPNDVHVNPYGRYSPRHACTDDVCCRSDA